MRGILGVEKMFYFGHIEFSDSEQLASGGNLVSEAQTELSGGEGEFALDEILQLFIVHEHSLGGFWSQVANGGSCGTDLGLKHEVEGLRVGEVILCIHGLDVKRPIDVLELLLGVGFGVLGNFE